MDPATLGKFSLHDCDHARAEALRGHSFVIHKPKDQSLPFVFASPHSGRDYPADFVRSSRLSRMALRYSEDAFIDELFAFVTAAGAPLIAARFPRAYVDVNRSSRELDPSMFDGGLTMPVESTGTHVSLGLGVIPRVIREGMEIYGDKLPPAEAKSRIAEFYEPYHAGLAGLVAETVARFGAAILIDCHSMPSGANIPDVVIGDRFGMSATPSLTHLAERAFSSQGYRVVRNVPYAGGYTTQLYGRRNGPVQALQIEINRGLYLYETHIERSPRFSDTYRRIAKAIGELLSADFSRLFMPGSFAQAAE